MVMAIYFAFCEDFLHDGMEKWIGLKRNIIKDENLLASVNLYKSHSGRIKDVNSSNIL
jgi:hypothetical protein